jgi:hypothetical protein
MVFIKLKPCRVYKIYIYGRKELNFLKDYQKQIKIPQPRFENKWWVKRLLCQGFKKCVYLSELLIGWWIEAL